MTQREFTVLMPYISADLVGMIAKEQNISEEDAIRILYASKLYSMLEDEETKLWHYSTPMLYSLFLQEKANGNIVFPDV